MRVPALVLSALGGLCLLFSCSDSGDGDGAGGTGATGGSAGAGGTSTDASDAGAGGADAADAAPEAGLKGTPGITCGTSTCDTTTELCCRKGNTSFWCAERSEAGALCTNADAGDGAAQWCDDSFDCASGEVCCRHPDGHEQVCAPAGSCDGREMCQPGSDCVTAGLTCITNVFGNSWCDNPSPAIPCAGATCTGKDVCCVSGQSATCMDDKSCQAVGGERYFCTGPSDCAGGMRCCGAGTGDFSACFFQCGGLAGETLCSDNGDCPTTAPNCTATQLYFDGAKYCAP